MTDTATVRVVVLNYNGGATTLDGLRSLAQSDWPADALDVVLVDNGSTDDVADTVAREMPGVTIIRSATNRGFAGGVNLGLRDLPASVRYVALLNSDARVDPGWLGPLVAALESNPRLGAACPKILLSGRYEEIELAGPAAPLSRLDRRAVTVRVSGARSGDTDDTRRVRFVEGFFGPEFGSDDEPAYEWAGATARLYLPARAGGDVPQLRLAAARDLPLVLRSAGGETTVEVGPNPAWYDVPPSRSAFDVVNNVGSELLASGYVRDRGYLERDVGQYDESSSVFAWSGGAVLLPARYLAAVGLFDERFFLYYEDVELAWRGRDQGWDYRTVPESVVRHIHMATSSSNLAMALYFNERNRLLLVGRHSPGKALASIPRFLAVTGSYFVRDVLARILRGDRPSWTIVRLRARALGSFLRLQAGLGTGRAPNYLRPG